MQISTGEPDEWEERRNSSGAVSEAKDRCVLEDFTQCSKSHLWKLMMSFYDRKGVESWSQVGASSGFDFVFKYNNVTDQFGSLVGLSSQIVGRFLGGFPAMSGTLLLLLH